MRSFISLMSAPAAKALSLPVMTTAPASLVASKPRRAALSSAMRGVLRALRALGRLRVTRGLLGQSRGWGD